MSASRRGAGGAQRLGAASSRGARVWRGLPPERRLAAMAALGLFVTLFLPWYQETVIASGLVKLESSSASLTGWGAFSFVEAAVLLVAAGVLFLLFMRAEGNAFHVPGGDGGVITAAGLWTCLLIIWRMFDKEGTTGHGQYATTWGIEWGIFVALAVAALLTYAGTRIRHAHEPEPPLPGDGAGPPAERDQARGGGSQPSRPSRTARSARSARSSRREHPVPTFDVDDTWRAQPPAREPVTPPPPSEATTRIVTEPPGTATPRRVRPRSIGTSGEREVAPAPQSSPAPASQSSPAPASQSSPAPASQSSPGPAPQPQPQPPEPPPARPARPARPAPAGSEDPTVPDQPRRRRGLDVREIHELDIAEPPTARLGRSRPSRPRTDPPQSDDPDDQLTLRLDRPS